MQNQYLNRLPAEWKERFLSGGGDDFVTRMTETHAQMAACALEYCQSHQKPIHRTPMASQFVPLGVGQRLRLEAVRLFQKTRNLVKHGCFPLFRGVPRAVQA